MSPLNPAQKAWREELAYARSCVENCVKYAEKAAGMVEVLSLSAALAPPSDPADPAPSSAPGGPAPSGAVIQLDPERSVEVAGFPPAGNESPPCEVQGSFPESLTPPDAASSSQLATEKSLDRIWLMLEDLANSRCPESTSCVLTVRRKAFKNWEKAAREYAASSSERGRYLVDWVLSLIDVDAPDAWTFFPNLKKPQAWATGADKEGRAE